MEDTAGGEAVGEKQEMPKSAAEKGAEEEDGDGELEDEWGADKVEFCGERKASGCECP